MLLPVPKRYSNNTVGERPANHTGGNQQDMRAVILAGGLGTRLRPFTNALPKPLVPIGDRPILDILLTQLRHSGFTHVTLACGHLAELIKAYGGHGERWGLMLDYVFEEQPLGTIGPLRQITNLPEHVLVMNADILTDLDFSALMAFHRQKGAAMTLACRELTTQIEYGVLDIHPKTGQMQGFREKPTLRHTTSMGIHVVNRDLLGFVPEGQLFGLDHFMSVLLEKHLPIQAYPFEGFWLDIGRAGDYEQARVEFEAMRGRFLPTELPAATAPMLHVVTTTREPQPHRKAAPRLRKAKTGTAYS